MADLEIPPKLARAFVRVAAAVDGLTTEETHRVLSAALAIVRPRAPAAAAAAALPARAPFAARVARRARRAASAQVCSICKRPGHNARAHKPSE